MEVEMRELERYELGLDEYKIPPEDERQMEMESKLDDFLSGREVKQVEARRDYLLGRRECRRTNRVLRHSADTLRDKLAARFPTVWLDIVAALRSEGCELTDEDVDGISKAMGGAG